MLLTSLISTFKQSQEGNTKILINLNQKLQKLEEDIAAMNDYHENATECAIKCARRDQPL